MKKVKKRNAGAKESSAKPNAIVVAALELFTRYGYRKTSVDDIAQAAQVAKRTVYLHFENKAAGFREGLPWSNSFISWCERQRGPNTIQRCRVIGRHLSGACGS